jgi:hypothetical protein
LARGGGLLATSTDSPDSSVNVRPIPDHPIPAPSMSALQLPSCSRLASPDCALVFAFVPWIGRVATTMMRWM